MFFFYYPSCFSFCYLLIVLFFLVVFRVLFLSVCFLFFFRVVLSPDFFFVELCFRVVFPFFPRVVLLSWFQVVVPLKKAKTVFEIVVQFFFF